MLESMRKRKGHWESFDDINGLGHECECLLEDKAGNIWVGTNSGLSRYDGRRFVNFTEKDGLVSNSVQCIHEDREGNIWIGTSSGLSRYDGKGMGDRPHVVNFTDRDGLASNYVYCVYQDTEGNIWIGTRSGLSRYHNNTFVNFTDRDGLASNHVHCVYQDRDGNIWAGTSSGLSRYDGKRFANFTREDGLADNYVCCIREDAEGNIWSGTSGGLSRYDGRGMGDFPHFVNFTHRDGLASNSVWSMHRDREGNIWVGTLGHGVSCYDGSEFVNFNTTHGLAHNAVLDIIQDREGSLWFACYHGGVSRYNPYEMSYISDEPVDEVVIQDRGGNLWWGFRNTLSRSDDKSVSHYPFEHTIFDLFEDSKGQFWVGTDGGGVFRYNSINDVSTYRTGNAKGQKPQNFTTDDGLVNNRVTRIYEDAQGNIWIGTRGGLSRYDGKGMGDFPHFVNFTTDDGLGNNVVSVIFQDSSGMLWFAGWGGGGITGYDGNSFHRYTTDDGLVDDRVMCIIEETGDRTQDIRLRTQDSFESSSLWIGTATGISYYNGSVFRNYTTADGLSGSFIQRIMRDSRGQIWIATLGGGVSRFDGRNFQALTMEDGLPSNCATGIIEDSNGNMIISTYRGICRYVPDYRTPPLIRIDEVDADRIYKEPEYIQISRDISSIRIRYHGVSFKTKKIRYNYFLESYDEDWKATWDEEARYENLPIGEYAFKVIATNRDLVYSETPAELKVSVIHDPRDVVISELEEKVRERTKELRDAKDYIDNVVKSMADTLIVVNPDGTIRTVNQATLDLLGYREHELIGKPIEMILAEEESLEESGLNDLIEGDFTLNIEKGFVRNVGNTYLSKDGRNIPVLFSGSIMQDDNGEIQGIVCVAQDITERRRAEGKLQESERKYRELVENANSIILRMDTHGRVTFFNEFAQSFFGYGEDEILGQNVVGTIVPETDTLGRDLVAMIRDIGQHPERYTSNENENVRRNGQRVWISWTNKPVLDSNGRITGILCIGNDITKRRQAEEELRKHRDHLEELVQERTEELTRTVEQLMQADKMASLGILVSGVAHEINNPNNFILLNAKIFSRAWNDVMPILQEYYQKHGDFALAGMPYTQAHERIGQLISGMSEGAQRIQKIVQGLKDFARQDTGDLNQSVDINAAVEAAILIVGNLIKKSTDRFSCEYASNLPRVRGNVQQLEQVIINLITNACHALQDGEKGLFISTSYERNSNSVVVEVRDEGTGISPENLKHIVDPFYTTKRDSGGTGLGLSISYNIVKAHGGDLSFISELGKGTTIILTLPIPSEVP